MKKSAPTKKSAFAIIAVLACVGSASAGPAASGGTWAGTGQFTRGAGPQPFSMSIELRGRRAVVALAPGHTARTEVVARRSRGTVRIVLPGRPWPLVLDGRVKAGVLSGSLRQGPLRGRFRLRRRAPIEGSSIGLYRSAAGDALGIVQALGPRAGVRYADGEIRALYPTRRGAYAVGAGLATRNPTAGTAQFTPAAATFRGQRFARVALRQEEVWVRSGGAYLACTLTIPPGAGRRPALAFAHGAGQAPRSFNLIHGLHANHLGLVTLLCDKRGIAQSGGDYPGEFPSASAVDQYARDVQAQARFLAAQPEVDARRIGIAGASQAGWIMPLAASREPAIRFMLGLVAPTLTQGETDLWANLNGQGQSLPARSEEEMEAEVRAAGPSGVDPLPAIRAMRIPAFWLYGGKDRTVPSRLCVERLDPLAREAGRDFTYRVFPGGTHGLILTANGLLDEQARSNSFVEGLFPAIRDWLAARGLTG
ncbi:MAG TPA: prolyl oligopeptidase family serine peptidase [Gaiellaceae bacterium]|nr:prolyl oligopeptidase family serine peptidase [Gaiellaceae bacterium]